MADEARLQALRQKFTARARDQGARAIELRGALAAGTLTPETLQELNRLCHSLHGAAGTFGFGEISEVAGEAEDLTDELIKAGALSDMVLAAKLDYALSRMLDLIAKLN